MAQSDIQSFLEQTLGTQSAIQSNLPVTPNNGNPGTIYNLSPSSVRQFNPATGNLPPMMDANGGWAVPATRPQGPPVDLATLLGQYTTQQRTVKPTPTTLVIPPAFITPPTGTPTSPPPAQPTAPPMSDPLPPQQVPGGGGSVTPPPSPPLTPPSNGGGGGATTIGNISNFDLGHILNQYTTGPTSGNTGTTNPVDWRQVLDVLSEPFLPGDIYLSGSGNWDLSNALLGQLESRLGLPEGTANDLMNNSGYMNDLLQSDPSSWNTLEKALVDHYMDNSQNQFDLTSQSITNNFNQAGTAIANAENNTLANEIATKYGIDIRTDPRAAQIAAAYQAGDVSALTRLGQTPSQINAGTGVGLGAAGAFTPWGASVIQGDAARGAFEAMKYAALAKGEFQTGTDILGRAYSK